MSIEVMKQALEALVELNEVSKGPSAIFLPAEIDTAMDALRQAIEFEEMVKKGTKAWDGTPDDWVDELRGGMERNADYERGFIDGRADQMKSSVDRAVNKMAQREWVGLAVNEAREFYESDLSREELIHKIDEFLEEKNT